MNQEKFVNQYIELLTATVAESVNKNIVIQSQKRVLEKHIEEMTINMKELEDNSKKLLKEKDDEIISLKALLQDSKRQSAIIGDEKEELRKTILHVETFKNELIKTRLEIDRLNEVIAVKDKELKSFNKKKATKEKVNVAETEPETKAEVIEETPKDVGNTWVKKEIKKKDTIKDAGKF